VSISRINPRNANPPGSCLLTPVSQASNPGFDFSTTENAPPAPQTTAQTTPPDPAPPLPGTPALT